MMHFKANRIYAVLARDEKAAQGDDDSDFVKVLLVEADNFEWASMFGRHLADDLGFELEAKHDGYAVYEVIARTNLPIVFTPKRQQRKKKKEATT